MTDEHGKKVRYTEEFGAIPFKEGDSATISMHYVGGPVLGGAGKVSSDKVICNSTKGIIIDGGTVSAIAECSSKCGYTERVEQ